MEILELPNNSLEQRKDGVDPSLKCIHDLLCDAWLVLNFKDFIPGLIHRISNGHIQVRGNMLVTNIFLYQGKIGMYRIKQV